MDFEEAILKTMEELKISRRRAMSELMIFMCGYGTIDDFKDYINYFIKNQEKLSR